MIDQFQTLKRPCYPMPEFVKQALMTNGVMDEYLSRPAYQQNDYIGWINRAVREETKQKRLRQTLAELKNGKVYMKMKYHPR